MLTHPNCIFQETIFRPLGGAGPSNFNALQIDQGLLAHIPNGDADPPKKFKGEHVKLGSKFTVCASITLRLVRVRSRNYHATCREAGVFKWAQLLGKARPLKFGRAKNV